MPRNASPTLTPAELPLMQVLWEQGPATVQEVMDRLPASHGLAYNTVLTMLRILETKGWLRHSKPKDERAFQYRAVLGREEAQRRDVRQLLQRFFGNSRRELVLTLLEEEKVGEKELRRLRALLDEEER